MEVTRVGKRTIRIKWESEKEYKLLASIARANTRIPYVLYVNTTVPTIMEIPSKASPCVQFLLKLLRALEGV